jgi:hypothetical protein
VINNFPEERHGMPPVLGSLPEQLTVAGDFNCQNPKSQVRAVVGK